MLKWRIVCWPLSVVAAGTNQGQAAGNECGTGN